MRKFPEFAAVIFALCLNGAAAGTEFSFVGTWSAPSLSQPDTPIILILLPGGKASEQVGTYHGVGTWKTEAGAAKISWASGWFGLLRPTTNGGFELLTWKKGSSMEGKPDDMQPAHRVEIKSAQK